MDSRLSFCSDVLELLIGEDVLYGMKETASSSGEIWFYPHRREEFGKVRRAQGCGRRCLQTR